MAQVRGRQLVRTWRLIALLRAYGGVTLEAAAHYVGVTTRTVRRDLEMLEETHLPIVSARDDEGVRRWRWLKGAPCPCCGHAPRKE